jgi:L-ascorbate metabolism protein UlaG (beta-lactamase superfamily)
MRRTGHRAGHRTAHSTAHSAAHSTARWAGATVIGLLMAATTALAAQPVSRCLAVAQAPHRAPAVHRVALGNAVLAASDVRLSFVGHSTFLIESAGGVRIVTDYNDYVRPPLIPDVATMNRAHSTHYTDSPDPKIAHVLRGWNPAGGPAKHQLEYKDVHIRNVPTNIRDWGGGATTAYGNSIFVFEVAGLCIGHLGHLHHTLTPEQIGAIGQLDVVLVPVDGGYTMDIGGMVEVVRALRARLIIPMHYFNQNTLARFIERMKSDFAVDMAPDPDIVLSARTLPKEPIVLVLPGR